MFNFLIVSIIFIFGMCIGSFLNVCIYRLPTSKSIADPPRSTCPGCNSPIRFYDNIPVLSYIWLKGRCRNCDAPISFRYPMVELITGIVALGLLFNFGLSLESLVYFVFISSLLVITFIDLDHRIIPDIVTLTGIPMGLVASFALPTISFKASVLGLLIGGGSLWLVAWAYSMIAKRDGMGGGDIKLLAMIGTIIGWKGVIFTVFASSVMGSCVGITIMLIKGKNMKYAIPFGPFLSIGAIAYVFVGAQIIAWYFS
ncbi:MAG: prepilin peptidase [Deltaproteobacteria bacterium]|nr:prepilin peptidase [Deltaproteobacteria bacterium]MBW2014399.1 prepilin peptidase [Deltaproteobacteria bacterium]MBW2089558.1 prepilin peptidase [Deltaproteobacteria bacterium]